jgi:hypothetical protein
MDTKIPAWTNFDRGVIDKIIEFLMTIAVDSLVGTWKPYHGFEMTLKVI